ncbi:MAG TPA: flagellar basal body rod protein FlgC [Candidatus Acidoferrales bacterium]|nr:flagellar basal body rod protein FlgC [Candidatus Acidoferrales bacterium]
MSLFDVFTIAGSALEAQSVRLNLTASNMANANNVAGSAQEAYRARQPYFAPLLNRALTSSGAGASSAIGAAGVRTLGVLENPAPPPRLYQPGHALADKDGYVYGSNVNPIDELVNMISASRSYQNNVEVLNTSKELLLRTLMLGQ